MISRKLALFLMLIMLLVLLHLRFQECHSVEYFINQQKNLPCTGQPCFTFQQFSANVAKFLKNDTVLRFNSGIHSYPSTGLIIANKERFSSTSRNSDTVITCQNSAIFQFDNVAMINLTNLTFQGCGKASPSAIAVIKITNSTIYINHCTFTHSKGRIIDSQFSEVTVTKSIFKLSYGIVLISMKETTVLVIDSVYELNNSLHGQMMYITLSNATFENCSFYNNSASEGNTRMIYITQKSTFTMNQCELASNKADMNILFSNDCRVNIHGTTFKHNFIHLGGILSLQNSVSIIRNSTFLNNTASQTGILRIYQSSVKIQSKLIMKENKARWGVLYIYQSKVDTYQNVTIQGNNATLSTVDFCQSSVKFLGNVLFLNNTGCILVEESLIEFTKLSTFSSNKQMNHQRNLIYEFGGAITSIWSTVRFNGTTIFQKNKSWKIGGAIFASESKLYVNNKIQFNNNSATKGGGMYLHNSNFVCNGNCSFIGNRALSKGGAIHAINSAIFIGYEWHKSYALKNIHESIILLTFVNNLAEKLGGGLSLEANGKLQGPLDKSCKYIIEFENNTAQKGGAIHVDDHSNIDTCKGKQSSTCFFNTPYYEQQNGQMQISSRSGKNTIYGGLLDRCITRQQFSDNILKNKKPLMIGIDHFKRVTNNPNITEMITSDPIRLCYCQGQNLNCEHSRQEITTRNGEAFKVPITAVDQVNRSVSASIYVQSRQTRIGTRQQVQEIADRCSNIILNIYSPNEFVNLILYAKGPCSGKGISKYTLRIHILSCMCPAGFQPFNKSEEGCSCECASKLKPLMIICDYNSQSLLRQGDFWINYIGNNDYIIYNHCPYDYCLPSTHNVSINLNLPNGADAQCAFSRSGLLCSSCKSNLSLSLGSSLCLSCSEDWPKTFVIILLGAIMSGIALVMVILVLNLTVAIGTLNGLIFYANIVASNNITYSPLSKSNFFSVLIAWLNLELGLDTCFYKGLDGYTKAWLQFIFPTYLITVLFMVIIMSKYSTTFAKLIGKRNPIATLATLILLSYMKFLRNIIDIFSSAVVYYDGSRRVLWLPDASIKYLQGKHIPLFLMAIAIVAIGIVYTFLLFTWQWLHKAPNYKLLRWTRNTRLTVFMEANLAAYNSKHRYWTGLLLLIRIALYLEIAYNNSYEMNISLLATGLIAACLLLVKTLYGSKVYKKKMTDYLDSFCYLNLLILSIAHLYSQHNKTRQIIITDISVSIAFLQLIFVLSYHTFNTLLEIPHLGRLKIFAQRQRKYLNLGETLPFASQGTILMTQTTSTHITPTSTEIGLSDSKEASAAEDRVEQDVSGQLPQLLTINTWKEETNSLREPSLQDSV